jgi:PKD repeat protein
MKRIFYIFLSFSLILLSCHKDPPMPDASFSTDIVDPEVGESVFFYNNSSNADSFEWDFGDGFISNEPNPVHTYNSTGTFEVILTVFSEGGEDQASMIIDVKVPTLLVIEVREYFSDDVIPGASVLLYPTLDDWDDQTNDVAEAFTDQDGVAVFSNLDPFVYYVDVWELNHDNYTLAAEDVGFIRTPEVVRNRITGFTAYVDVADHSSGFRINRDNMVMKKSGRNSSEKKLVPSFSGTEDWERFYSKSKKK